MKSVVCYLCHKPTCNSYTLSRRPVCVWCWEYSLRNQARTDLDRSLNAARAAGANDPKRPMRRGRWRWSPGHG